MSSLTLFHRRFTPNLFFFIILCMAVALFLRLGFWQLSRAQEKQHLIQMQQQMKKKPVLLWTPDDNLPSPFQDIKITGQYSQPLLLLDNQHQNHQFGYNVITPVLLKNKAFVLVDRGWVAGDLSRKTLPAVFTPKGINSISGEVYYPLGKPFLLGEFAEQKSKNLIIIEMLDTKKMSQILHNKVYPFIIRLGKNEANGFKRHWSVVSMPPARHYGYALQWFAFAFIALILFIVLSFKKTK